MKQIKPCPFCDCGITSTDEISEGAWTVICKVCGACGPTAETEELAVAYWNAAWRKEDAEMEKNCGNCKYLKLGNKAKSKWYCTKALEDEYSSCKSWAPHNPFKPTQMTVCNECQYEYWDNGEHYCGKAIWNLDYSCPGWEAKEPKSTPLNSEDSSVKPFINCAKEELIGIRIREPFFNVIQQIAEEAAELAQAALKYGRTKGMGSYTKVNPKDARDFMIEEFADVLLCMEAAFPHCSESTDFYSKLERTYCEKAKQWAERLKDHDN